MSELTVSKYLNNKPASKKKRIYSRLLDYFSMFVVAYLFFTIFYSIGYRTPLVKGYSNDYKQCSKKIMDYIADSRLLSYNEKKNDFIDADETAKEYLVTMTKTSAYIHNMQIPVYQEDDTYILEDVNIEETFLHNSEQYDLDNLSYYFNIFKKTDTKLNNYTYGGVDYSSDIETYQYKKAMAINDEDYHVASDDEDYIARGSAISKYLVLTTENTTRMINRAIKGEKIDEATTTLYGKLFNFYRRGIDFGTKDIEKNSLAYAKLNNNFKNSYQRLSRTSAVIYVIAYATGFIVLNGIVCLISKDFVTIGQKVMSLGLCDTHENNLSWWRILIYQLMNFIMFFSSAIISFYFIGIFGVLSYEICPRFTLMAVLVFLIVLNIFSLGMIIFSHKNHDLSSLAGGVLVKDKIEFETSPENDLNNITIEETESGTTDQD